MITDMHQTTTALVNSSQLPLSVIIIGVGGADFTDMEVFAATSVGTSALKLSDVQSS